MMKNETKMYLSTLMFIFLLVFLSCQIDNSVEDGDYYYPLPVYSHIDGLPVGSPDGKQIMYYHGGIRRISKYGLVEIDPDSAGLWIINRDGTDAHLVWKGYSGGSYDWSRDGNWIVFESGAQIYKVPIIGDSIVVSQIQQLTFGGRNFFPAWSPDGQWIAYDKSITDGNGPAGTWIMKADGFQNRFIASGRCPDWLNTGLHIIYVGFHNEIYRVNLNDPSKVIRLTSLNQINIYATDNRYPHYSPDGAKIVFQSQAEGEYPQIWVMDANGNNLQKLTTDGGFTPSWVDNNTIAYIGFKPRGLNLEEYLKNHGTLWVMNSDGSHKKQLTFFYGEVVNQIQ